MPNIYGQFFAERFNAGVGIEQGALQLLATNYNIGYVGGNTVGGCTYGFDASYCSEIFGSSDTVQPAAITIVFLIKY